MIFSGNDVNQTSAMLTRYGLKYDGMFTLWMPDPIIVITDPKLLREVLLDQGT